jgi:transcriptional regulator with XRE-family HTH domain
MDIKNVGKNLRILRKDQRLSQEELAKKIGCEQTAISNWEIGSRTPDLHYVKKISEALDVPPSLLLNEDDQLEDSLKHNALLKKHRKQLKIVTENELRDYALRKKLAKLLPNPLSNMKDLTWHNIVLFKANPNINLYLNVEIEGPYGDGDTVVFDDTKSKKVVLRQFKIIKGKYYLCPVNDTQTIIPLWSESQRYHYIGKVLLASGA